jgi:hypothetical protein
LRPDSLRARRVSAFRSAGRRQWRHAGSASAIDKRLDESLEAFATRPLAYLIQPRKRLVLEGLPPPHFAEDPSIGAPTAAIASSSKRRFICQGCYFIFDDSLGAPEHGA